jgi:hypothetical protein
MYFDNSAFMKVPHSSGLLLKMKKANNILAAVAFLGIATATYIAFQNMKLKRENTNILSANNTKNTDLQ